VSSGDVPIDALLAELGHTSQESRRAARRAIEAAGLTNPRKRNIAAEKREAVAEALAERLVRTCGSERCERATGRDRRPRALVERRACEVCGGSGNAASVARMVEAMRAAGRTRLLVVGGSPNAHAELRLLLDGSDLDLRAVDGTAALPQKRALAWAEWADVIAVWGGTMLTHKVSSHFPAPAYRSKRLTAMHRGVAGLADAVVQHLDGGRAG
jgi:hypothetical protein